MHHALSHGLRLLLVTSLLAISTPAAPTVLSYVAASLRSDLSYWYKARALAFINKEFLLLQGGGQRRGAEEEQSDRDALVIRVHVSPGRASVPAGERLFMSAVAYGQANDAVGGVTFTWKAENVGHADQGALIV